MVKTIGCLVQDVDKVIGRTVPESDCFEARSEHSGWVHSYCSLTKHRTSNSKPIFAVSVPVETWNKYFLSVIEGEEFLSTTAWKGR